MSKINHAAVGRGLIFIGGQSLTSILMQKGSLVICPLIQTELENPLGYDCYKIQTS
jgi:hypothetical protein